VSFYLQPFIFAIEKRGVILIKSGFACLIGRPNVGKSTLLNQFIGHKVAIVSDKPQTTRNRILGILTTEDVQVVFIDTPGIHKPRHKLGAYMTRIAQETLEEVDLGIYVVDASVNIGRGEEYILKQLQSISTPVILVVNKIDLITLPWEIATTVSATTRISPLRSWGEAYISITSSRSSPGVTNLVCTGIACTAILLNHLLLFFFLAQ
jgi:small GTP-binding protein